MKTNLKDYIENIIDDEYMFLENEVWKKVKTPLYPNLKNYYCISNYGRVYSTKTDKFIKLRERKGKNKYVNVCLKAVDKHGKSIKKEIPIHRLMMAIFYPVDNMENLQVNHIDCNKHHNTFDNLEWVTPSENIQHAYKNNLITVREAEDSPFTNYSNETIDTICKLFMTGKYSKEEIAEKVGVPIYIVRNVTIKNGSWKKITSKYDFSKRPMYKKSKKFNIQDIERICQYFCDYPRENNQSVRNYIINCINYLKIKPHDNCSLENFLYSIRLIYLRKSYINISNNYSF